jgi:DNA-binding transcriptional LysR family regulator
MRFDLTTIKLFLSAVEQGSIAGAAEANSIAPSAVSHRISDLEGRLGTTLLFRQTKGVTPTPAGDALSRHARNLVALMARMEAEMSEYTDGVRGHVRIVANTSAIIQFLPDDLSAFKSDYPDVRVGLREQTSEQAVQDITKGLADIAIFSEAISSLELEVFPYRQDQLVVISPNGHPLAGKKDIRFIDTLDFQHVGLHQGSSLLGQLQSEALKLERSISFVVQVTSFDGVRRMVECGLGVAVLPDGAVLPRAAEQQLTVTPLTDTWATRTLYVGVREAAALTLAAHNMLTRLIDNPLQPMGRVK